MISRPGCEKEKIIFQVGCDYLLIAVYQHGQYNICLLICLLGDKRHCSAIVNGTINVQFPFVKYCTNMDVWRCKCMGNQSIKNCHNRELKQWWRQRRGQRLLKNELMFYLRNYLDWFSTPIDLKALLNTSWICNDSFHFWKKIGKISGRGSRSPKYAELGQRTEEG